MPESMKNHEIQAFFTNLLHEALPDLPLEELAIDRIHRLPKYKHLPDRLPRDTIARIHFYRSKEKLMALTRKSDNWPECMQGHSFFTDLSQYILQSRRNLATVTKALRNHNIPYRWNYPAKLQITKGNDLFIISTLDEGCKSVKSLPILPQHLMSPRCMNLNQTQQKVEKLRFKFPSTFAGPQQVPLLSTCISYLSLYTLNYSR